MLKKIGFFKPFNPFLLHRTIFLAIYMVKSAEKFYFLARKF